MGNGCVTSCVTGVTNCDAMQLLQQPVVTWHDARRTVSPGMGAHGANGGKGLLDEIWGYLGTTLLLLADDNYISLPLVALGFCIEFLQMMGPIFPDNLTNFPWSSRDTSAIRQLLHVVDSRAITSLFGTTFGPLITALFVALVLGAWITVSYWHHLNNDIKTHAKILRLVLSAASSALYIPVLQTLILMILSGGAGNILLGIICTPVYVLSMFTVVAALFDVDFESKAALARPHSRIELAYMLLKTMMVIIGTSITAPTLLTFLACAMIGIVFGLFFHFLPYYNLVIVRFRCTLLALLLWTYMSAFMGILVNDPIQGGPIYIVYGAAPVVVFVVALFLNVRIKQIRDQPETSIVNPWEAELKYRLAIQDVYSDAAAHNTSVAGELDKDQQQRRTDTVYSTRIMDIIERSCDAFPSSPIILIRLAYFHFTLFNVPFVAYTKLAEASAGHPFPDLAYMILRLQKGYAERVLRAEVNRDVVAYNEYVKYLSAANKSDVELTRALVSLWTELIQPTPNANKMRSVAHQISWEMNAAEVAYKSSQAIWSDSYVALVTYAGFLETLINDSSRSKRILAKADDIRLQKRTNHDNSFRVSLFTDTNVVIVISGDIANLGEVLDANSAIRGTFGIGRSAIIGKNVNVLMPELIATHHNAMLRRNLSNGRGTVLGYRRRLICRHTRTGYIFEATVYIKSFIEREHLSLLGIIEPYVTSGVTIICRPDGLICAVTEMAEAAMGAKLGKNIVDILVDWAEVRGRAILRKDGQGVRASGNVLVSVEIYPLAEGQYADVVRVTDLLTMAHVADTKDHLDHDSIEYILEESNDLNVQVAALNDGEDADGSRPTQRTLSIESQSNASSSFAASQSRGTGNILAANSRRVSLFKQDLSIGHGKEGNIARRTSRDEGGSAASSGISEQVAVDETARIARERNALGWLRKSVMTALLMAVALSIGALFTLNDMLAAHQTLALRISESSSRATDLISMALFAAELQSQGDLIVPGDPARDAYCRSQIALFATSLFQKNAAEIGRIDSWSPAFNQLNRGRVRSGLSGQSGVNMMDALSTSVAYGRETTVTPTPSLHASTPNIIFLVDGAVSDAVFALTSTLITDAVTPHVQFTLILTYIPILSLLALFMLIVFALRTSVISVLSDKDDVFIKLFLVPRARVITLIQPCMNRLRLLNEEQAVLDAPNADNVALPMESHQHEDDRPSQKGQHHKKNFAESFKVNNRDKRKRYLALSCRVLVACVVYIVLFATTMTVMSSLASRRQTFPVELQWTRHEEFLVRRSLLSLRLYIAGKGRPDAIVTDAARVLNDLSNAQTAMSDLMYGSPSLGIPAGRLSTSTSYYALQFTSICVLPVLRSVPDCPTFLAGVNANGMQAVLTEFSSLMNTVLNRFDAQIASVAADLVPGVVTSTLTSPDMTNLIRLEDVFLRPAMLAFVQIELNDLQSNDSSTTTFALMFMIIFGAVNLGMYLGLVRPILISLASEFTESRDLLNLIPDDLRVSGILKLYGGVHHSSAASVGPDMGGISEDDEANYDDRNMEEVALYRARRMARLRAVQERRNSYIRGIHGVLKNHKLTALAISVAIVLVILIKMDVVPFRRMPSLIEFAMGGLAVLGGFISGATPMDMASATLPLMLRWTPIEQAGFSFVNTAVGSGAASIYILLSGTQIQWELIRYASVGGLCGTALGLKFLQGGNLDILQVAVSAAWIAVVFGIMFTMIALNTPLAATKIPLDFNTRIDMIMFGFIGGTISGAIGAGMNTFVFGMSTLYFCTSTAVGVPTAIMLSAMNSLSALAVMSWAMPAGIPIVRTLSMLRITCPIMAIVTPLGAMLDHRLELFFAVAIAKFASVDWVVWTKTQSSALIFITIGALLTWIALAVVVAVSGAIQSAQKHKVND